ncbi:hypothetical protein D3C80_1409660 [compost metagenome]
MIIFVLLRHAHPGDQQPATIFGLGGLRRIEFEAEIQLVEGAMFESGLPIIQFASEIARLINVEILFGLRRQPLWATDQYLDPVQCEQVRAFPHIAEIADAVQL